MGCCYNYATDKQGRPPGILTDEPVNGLPPMLDDVVDRMVARRIFTSATRPDSCIINLYSEGDCIPPHIDHHDFVRPFVTLSLLSEQPILFGKEIKIVEDGIFDAPVRVALPVGSVLVLNGNGADVAKHCVPAVSGERVSITFRKMRGVTLGSKKKTVEYKGPDCAPPAVDFRVRA
jgi:alkylated DNA repair protein alkB family protein 5